MRRERRTGRERRRAGQPPPPHATPPTATTNRSTLRARPPTRHTTTQPRRRGSEARTRFHATPLGGSLLLHANSNLKAAEFLLEGCRIPKVAACLNHSDHHYVHWLPVPYFVFNTKARDPALVPHLSWTMDVARDGPAPVGSPALGTAQPVDPHRLPARNGRTSGAVYARRHPVMLYKLECRRVHANPPGTDGLGVGFGHRTLGLAFGTPGVLRY